MAVVLILFGGLFLLGEEPYWGAAVPLWIVAAFLLVAAAIPIGPCE